MKHEKFKNWFKVNMKEGVDTRSIKLSFKPVTGNKKIIEKSPFAYMTEMLNKFNN